MNLLTQSRDVNKEVLDLQEAGAREAQICVQILAANIEKPYSCSVLVRSSNACWNAGQACRSATNAVYSTFFANIQNKDIGRLTKALHQIPQTIKMFSRKFFLQVDQTDCTELSTQARLLQRISDTSTEMIVAFCRRDSLNTMLSHRGRLESQEEEADKLTQYRISALLRNNLAPSRTIIALSLYNAMREIFDACLNAGNLAFELHLKYA